ncbi:MAG: DUF2750 domain-containing protein [Aquisalimonadaceae bacterium]
MIKRTDFDSMDFEGGGLDAAGLDGSGLEDADLEDVDLENIDLDDIDLEDIDLEDIDLDDTDEQSLDPDILRFIEEVAETGMAWGLEHPEGWALSSGSEDSETLVMPLWSRQEDASACASDDWSAYSVASIGLDELLEFWLVGLHDDGYRVGINWDTELEGSEIPPLELQADLERVIDEMDSKEG